MTNTLPEVQPDLRGLDLLDAALAFVDSNRVRHEQDTYGHVPREQLDVNGQAEGMPCGSTGCLATWIVYIGGAKLTYNREFNRVSGMRADGDYVPVVAASMLGLAGEDGAVGEFRYNGAPTCNTEFDRRGIFHHDNTVEDLHLFRDLLAAGTYAVGQPALQSRVSA